MYFLLFWFIAARFGEIFLMIINSHFFYIFIWMIVTLATNKNYKENKLEPWSRYSEIIYAVLAHSGAQLLTYILRVHDHGGGQPAPHIGTFSLLSEAS